MTRFPALWFYLLVAWLVAAAVADIRYSKTHPDAPGSWRRLYSRPALLLLAWAAVAGFVLGGQLIVFVLTPAVWLPFLAPVWWSRRMNPKRPPKPAPAWLRGFAALLTVGAVSLVPVSLLFLPRMENEPSCRMKAGQTRKRMERVAEVVTSRFEGTGVLPEAASVKSADEVYSVFSVDDPTGLDPSGALRAADFEDPFAYVVSHNLGLEFPVGYPFSLLAPFEGGWGQFIHPDDRVFSKLQYVPLAKGFLFWARGPDTVFSPEVADLLRNAPDSLSPDSEEDEDASSLLTAPPALSNFAYDPTNGTFSPGDMFLWTPHPSNQ